MKAHQRNPWPLRYSLVSGEDESLLYYAKDPLNEGVKLFLCWFLGGLMHDRAGTEPALEHVLGLCRSHFRRRQQALSASETI